MNRRQEYFFKTSLRPCKLSLIEMLFITIYSALWILIIPLILLLGIFSRSIKRQLSHRALGMPSFPARISESRTAVFYCSSAGEYEQAKPVIDRLRNIHQISSVIYFFSRSGYDYAQARNEQAPRFLTPPDTWLHWHSIFKRLQPCCIFIVRHELWPAFIFAAKSFCPIVVINASVDSRTKKSLLNQMTRTWLIKKIDGIFAVSSIDRDALIASGIDAARITVTGDTKYDRVIERAHQNNPRSQKIINDVFKTQRLRLIIGSAWLPEVQLLLPALAEIQKRFPQSQWQLIVAPHDTSSEMVGKICLLADQLQLKHLQMSLILQTSSISDSAGSAGSADILIIDKMGFLAELYKNCELAVVGGGLHHRVHNILEPACYGLPIAFGPLYHNSAEAEQLMQRGLGYVINNQDDIIKWWVDYATKGAFFSDAIKQFTLELSGAADKIVDALSPILINKENQNNG